MFYWCTNYIIWIDYIFSLEINRVQINGDLKNVLKSLKYWNITIGSWNSFINTTALKALEFWN